MSIQIGLRRGLFFAVDLDFEPLPLFPEKKNYKTVGEISLPEFHPLVAFAVAVEDPRLSSLWDGGQF